MDEPTERLLDYDGGHLYVRDHAGRSPAIVAMHGFPDDSRIYDRLVGPLDPQRVVTFDWIGYGRSSRRDTRKSSAICHVAAVTAWFCLWYAAQPVDSASKPRGCDGGGQSLGADRNSGRRVGVRGLPDEKQRRQGNHSLGQTRDQRAEKQAPGAIQFKHGTVRREHLLEATWDPRRRLGP